MRYINRVLKVSLLLYFQFKNNDTSSKNDSLLYSMTLVNINKICINFGALKNTTLVYTENLTDLLLQFSDLVIITFERIVEKF